jgi:glycine/D-amino acid oxidase-like deaminating enzyme
MSNFFHAGLAAPDIEDHIALELFVVVEIIGIEHQGFCFDIQNTSERAPLLAAGKLAAQIRCRGASILTGTNVCHLRSGVAVLQTSGCPTRQLFADVFVCAAGYGISQFFLSLLGIKLPMRYFASHLLDIPRFARHDFFGVGSSDIATMHHGDWTIVGFTKDQIPVSTPRFEPDEDSIEQIKKALSAIAPGADILEAKGRVCTKVDIDYAAPSSASFGT